MSTATRVRTATLPRRFGDLIFWRGEGLPSRPSRRNAQTAQAACDRVMNKPWRTRGSKALLVWTSRRLTVTPASSYQQSSCGHYLKVSSITFTLLLSVLRQFTSAVNQMAYPLTGGEGASHGATRPLPPPAVHHSHSPISRPHPNLYTRPYCLPLHLLNYLAHTVSSPKNGAPPCPLPASTPSSSWHRPPARAPALSLSLLCRVEAEEHVAGVGQVGDVAAP